MTATERYEETWNLYLKRLNSHPTAKLSPFAKERHTNLDGMKKWMKENGLSISEAKTRIKACQRQAREEKLPPNAETTGMMFLPVSNPESVNHDATEGILSGISFVFPDGTQVSIKHGSARALISLLKLYREEGEKC